MEVSAQDQLLRIGKREGWDQAELDQIQKAKEKWSKKFSDKQKRNDMELKVVNCFNTSLGLVVMIESSKDFFFKVGTEIKNNNDEIWIVKVVSFQAVSAIKELNDDLVARGYQIEPVSILDNRYIDCEMILSNRWFLVS